MIERMRQLLRREDGAVELIVALSLVVILGIVALVVDVGNAKQARRNFQTAADSGSLAGAQNLLTAGTPATAEAFAAHYAFDSMNQPRGSSIGCPGSPYPAAPTGAVCYQSGTSGAVVYVTTPYTCPTTGATAGSGTCAVAQTPANTVNVRVCQQLSTSFARVLNINTTMVCNSGTSSFAPSTGNCVLCVMSTPPAGTCTFQLIGTSGLNVTGVPPGPILVNDPNSGAVCGNGTTDVNSPGGFYYVGCHGSGSSCISGSGSVNWTTNPAPGPASQDPLRNVQPPSVTTQGNCTTSGSNETCTPGIYSTLTPLHMGTTCLQSGVYVITGGIPLKTGDTLLSEALGGSGFCQGSPTGGVMIYFTCSGYSASSTPPTLAPCNGQGAGFSGNGGSVGTAAQPLAAMTSGAYSGLVIFADRGNTQTIMDSDGGIAYTTKGTVYGLNASVSLGGNSGATMDSRFVIGSLSMHGTPNINEIYSDQFQGLPTVGSGISLVG